MAVIRIKQGDQYSIPIALKLNGEDIDINDIAEVEFTFGNGLRKVFPPGSAVQQRRQLLLSSAYSR